MRKKVHDDELMFDVNDTRNVKLGKDLHIKNVGYIKNPPYEIDWSVESLLIAHEIAHENNADLISIPDTVITWKFCYYCRINGQTYHVTETRKSQFGDIKYTIRLI